MKASELKKLGNELRKKYDDIDAQVDNASVGRLELFARASDKNGLYNDEDAIKRVLAAAFPGNTRTMVQRRSDYRRIMLTGCFWDDMVKSYDKLQASCSTKVHKWRFLSALATPLTKYEEFDEQVAKQVFNKLAKKVNAKKTEKAPSGPLSSATVKRWVRSIEKEKYKGVKAKKAQAAIDALSTLAEMLG